MKEWYLIGNNTKPNVIGGYENQSFCDYKQDAFAESLETDIASTVLLYNSDLSVQKEIRCIIEGNTADTQLQSMQRKGLFLCDTVKDGMYILFENGYWLINGFPGTNGIYQKATMVLCQFRLAWQNPEGKIVERWACAEDFTKYSNGLKQNNVLISGDNQYGLILPVDYETKRLKRDMRFPIDFEDSDEPDIYKLTNRKAKLSDSSYTGHGGTMIATMSLDSFNKSNDKKIKMEDGRDIWICNYKNPNTTILSPSYTSMTDINTTILGSSKIKLGVSRTYTVSFINKDKQLIDWGTINFKWNILCDFEIEQYTYENKIDLLINDENCIDTSFVLQVIINGKIATENKITITATV